MKKLLGLFGCRTVKLPGGTRVDDRSGIYEGGGGGGGRARIDSGRNQASLMSVDRRIRLGRRWSLVRNRSGSAQTLLRRRPSR